MKLKNILYRLKLPCAKCPYRLGLAQAIASPCPWCKLSGYEAFEMFQQLVLRDYWSLESYIDDIRKKPIPRVLVFIALRRYRNVGF